MTQIKLSSLFLLLVLISCTNKNEKTNDLLTFGDLVTMEKLEKVKMSNNSGTFELNNKQIVQIKQDWASMEYDPNISVKVGAIHMELTIEGKLHTISTATHGNYVEVHETIVTQNKSSVGTVDWLYFKTGDVNFDNYKEEN